MITRIVSIGLFGALVAAGCVGDDPTGALPATADAGSVADSGEPPADAAATDGPQGVSDAAPACTSTLPFLDDFAGRTAVEGCWDALTKTGALAATSRGELVLLPGTTNQSFHVALEPPDGGAAGGAVYLAKKWAQPVPAPLRLSFKWLAERFPTGGDGQNGLFAVEIVYQYKDGGGFRQSSSVSVAFGVNVKSINPYLRGEPYMPAASLEAGGLFESAIELDATTAVLRTKNAIGFDRTTLLPTGTERAVTEIRLGVTEVGSISGAWSLHVDDVLLDKL